MIVEIFFGDSKVPIEKAKKLLLHKVYLCQAETEVIVTRDSSVSCPMFILGRGIVKVLGGEDERGKEDAMSSALHALCHWR